MTRRYTDVESKPAAELVPGDQVIARRIVVRVTRTAEQVEVEFDDGTSLAFDLAGDPAVEVVATA